MKKLLSFFASFAVALIVIASSVIKADVFYFDNSNTGWGSVHVWSWSEEDPDWQEKVGLTEFLGDGTELSIDEATGYYYWEVNETIPSDVAVMFTCGWVNTCNELAKKAQSGMVCVPTMLNEDGLWDGYWGEPNNVKCTVEGDVLTVSGNGELNSYNICSLDGISKIIIEDGITGIGENVLEGKSVRSISIPSTLVYIGEDNFLFCTNLIEIKVDANNEYFTAVDNVLYNKDKTTLLACPITRTGEFIIPEGVVNIGDTAFCHNKKLTNVIIPKTVNRIESSAFFLMYGIEKITIPNSVKYIGHNAFAYTSFEKIVIPDSVTSIGIWTFNSCEELKSAYIGKGLTELTEGMFKDCNSLEEIIIPSNVEYISDTALPDIESLKIICEKGSYAEEFARANDYMYSYLEYIDISENSAVLSKTVYEYSGKANKPKVTIEGLIEGEDFEVKYSNNVNVGVATVTITGINYHVGTITKTFQINPTTTKITGLTAGGREFNIKWNKIASQVSGYQVQYSSSSTFNGYKIATISGNSTVSKKITGLVAGRKYYVRMRTYKTVNGVNYKSAWSAIRTVTTNPVTTKITGLTAGGRAFTVKWNKVASQVSGYQVQYSSSSKFNGYKIATISGNSTVSKKITGLVAGRKYYVRVRTYRSVNGVNYKSVWSATKTVTAKPVATSIKGLTAGSKAFTVKWNKVANQVSGYQVQYSSSLTFNGYKIATISGNSTVSKKITGLVKGKTYYVRVRTYRTVNGIKCYSAWSVKKHVKVK